MYTIQNFYDDALKIALQKDIDYVQVDVKISKVATEFRAYAHGYSFHEGATPAEALQKLEYAIFPERIPIAEMCIDISDAEVATTPPAAQVFLDDLEKEQENPREWSDG